MNVVNSHSISENTYITYEIPTSSTDEELKSYISRSDKTKPVVVVQGLGFVGLAMALVIANSNETEYTVIGVDQAKPHSYWKICEINNGICPIQSSDPLFDDYFQNATKKGNFFATFDETAYRYAEVIIVDVNLDVEKKLDERGSLWASDVPLEGFKKAIDTIANNCKEDVLLIVETTVPPGTCSRLIQPAMVKCLSRRGLNTDKFSIGHSYERVMPGPNYINSIRNFYRVFSGIDNKSADKTKAFLETIICTKEYPLTRLENTQSTELAKVLENSFRAMNISFMVEWSRFAEEAGVNLYEVVSAIRQRPTHANMMLPGIGVGGYCLTKDPIMASWASRNFFDLDDGLKFSVKAVEVNDMMPQFAYDFFKKCIFKLNKDPISVSLLGVAYAPGIGDTRYSPVEPFARSLEKQKFVVEYHDPYVNFWTEMSKKVSTELFQLTSIDTDVVVITTGHQKYVESNTIYEHLCRFTNKPLLIDMVGLINYQLLDPEYVLGQNFFVLGVGNSK